MSKSKTRRIRRDTNYDPDQYAYIESTAKKEKVAFAQVARRLLDKGISAEQRNARRK